jgi:hypothetical protein
MNIMLIDPLESISRLKTILIQLSYKKLIFLYVKQGKPTFNGQYEGSIYQRVMEMYEIITELLGYFFTKTNKKIEQPK